MEYQTDMIKLTHHKMKSREIKNNNKSPVK